MTITRAQGFRAAGIASGIKDNAKDLALVVNDGPNKTAAAVFTTNRMEAAPVTWSRKAIADHVIDAVILNSGGANACTGQPGYDDAVLTAHTVSAALEVPVDNVAVCSTGLIGERLPMDALLPGVSCAVDALSADGGADAATAIMTTDTVPKQAGNFFDGYYIGGMAKGAGMLAPALATMLVVITTDADVSGHELDEALRVATSWTFDRIDSDGCMSTNDTVIALASGASGVRPDINEFTQSLTEICQDLALQLIADAEGSAHDIKITVTNAASVDDALTAARSVARSNLFKCAIFGNDPNWGRIVSSVGATDVSFEPDQIDVTINGVQVCRSGGVGDDRSLVDLTPRSCAIVIDLHAGAEQATIWTNDLTYDYVKENAEYSS